MPIGKLSGNVYFFSPKDSIDFRKWEKWVKSIVGGSMNLPIYSNDDI